jgi:hypothetical protein
LAAHGISLAVRSAQCCGYGRLKRVEKINMPVRQTDLHQHVLIERAELEGSLTDGRRAPPYILWNLICQVHPCLP